MSVLSALAASHTALPTGEGLYTLIAACSGAALGNSCVDVLVGVFISYISVLCTLV